MEDITNMHTKIPTGDMIPALIIAMPVSYIWTNFIVPLL